MLTTIYVRQNLLSIFNVILGSFNYAAFYYILIIAFVRDER